MRFDDVAVNICQARSQASKVGRFPPTPSTDFHPLVVGTTTTTTTSTTTIVHRYNPSGGGGGGGEVAHDLGELCARWRAVGWCK